MLAAIAEGRSRIENYSTGADCQSTLGALRALGVEIARENSTLNIGGRGLHGLREPAGTLDAGNSGSTIRMLSGILAGQPFVSRIAGDESLSRRPMERIMRPLAEMGAAIHAREGRYPPLEIHGGALRSIDYALPVASAQVKSCVLLAGLYAGGATTVREPLRTRDHTEIALREFGADIDLRDRGTVTVQGHPRLTGRNLRVPGDLSSAAFFIVAALLLPGSRLTIENAGLNPTRATLLDFLASIGAPLRVISVEQSAGELAGDIVVEHARVRGGTIQGAITAALIDELPVLAVLGAASDEGLVVRDAQELRIKETDRIATLAENFRRMGVAFESLPDGFRVAGGQRFRAAELDSFGDHRIAMAFAVAALAADGACPLVNSEVAAVSYPEFFATLRDLTSD
jgi:3-phosphoshikimate 1-carboxyvinyltransferase